MNRLALPDDLASRDFFVVVWDRDEGRYILILGDKTSFVVEDGPTGLALLSAALGSNQYMAERCLDTARNFVAAVCYPAVDSVVSATERFVQSLTETELVFAEKNRIPWPGITGR